mmetsp:Transcript_5240/g.15943  ORF Transcript_5240/g.15943 Transcript_5240/m.15943 type:complete len:366 (+) Transcript_5240:262-1359(+)|eukprot:CAMPEP_0206311840 /NCGR_PEP_ID=MMETSP0106_2-20121207/13676_1 /ASSEMBLY_ACC=CAM_ASM_000206 /TAXON_ID=81532 /ORGANISM="Acanthoeca-like sp., Strain 10tr" /LENGTH=365 /DNA_ID=CAMNT_0053743111 /DNA_START=257 /DNA_END=1354 /DNA_ORIENTATION=+
MATSKSGAARAMRAKPGRRLTGTLAWSLVVGSLGAAIPLGVSGSWGNSVQQLPAATAVLGAGRHRRSSLGLCDDVSGVSPAITSNSYIFACPESGQDVTSNASTCAAFFVLGNHVYLNCNDACNGLHIGIERLVCQEQVNANVGDSCNVENDANPWFVGCSAEIDDDNRAICLCVRRTDSPTAAPTAAPTGAPTSAPTTAPTATGAPTSAPTTAPTAFGAGGANNDNGNGNDNTDLVISLTVVAVILVLLGAVAAIRARRAPPRPPHDTESPQKHPVQHHASNPLSVRGTMSTSAPSAGAVHGEVNGNTSPTPTNGDRVSYASLAWPEGTRGTIPPRDFVEYTEIRVSESSSVSRRQSSLRVSTV